MADTRETTRFRLEIFDARTERLIACVALSADDARAIAHALGYTGAGEWRIDAYFGEDASDGR